MPENNVLEKTDEKVVQRYGWTKAWPHLIFKIDGVEKLRLDVTAFPEEIQRYAMLDRLQAKHQDNYAKAKGMNTDDDVVAAVEAMHRQLMDVGWNSGTRAGGGEVMKMGKTLNDKVKIATFEELVDMVRLGLISQVVADIQIKDRKLTPPAPPEASKTKLRKNGR